MNPGDEQKQQLQDVLQVTYSASLRVAAASWILEFLKDGPLVSGELGSIILDQYALFADQNGAPSTSTLSRALNGLVRCNAILRVPKNRGFEYSITQIGRVYDAMNTNIKETVGDDADELFEKAFANMSIKK